MTRPGSVERTKTRLDVFIADDVTGDDELTNVGQVHNATGRELRWTKIETKSTTISKMTITGATLPGDGDTGERTEEAEMCKGGGAFAKKGDGGLVATGRLREAVTNPVSGLDSKGM